MKADAKENGEEDHDEVDEEEDHDEEEDQDQDKEEEDKEEADVVAVKASSLRQQQLTTKPTFRTMGTGRGRGPAQSAGGSRQTTSPGSDDDRGVCEVNESVRRVDAS